MAFYDGIARFFLAPGATTKADSLVYDETAAHKATALAQVRAAAAAEDRKPTLEDYYQACVALGAEKGLEANEWNAAIFADLKGQDLSGFYLSDPKARAPEAKDAHNAMSEVYDQDSNGQIDIKPINKFFDSIQLDNAVLDGAYVEPASSFNEQIAKAGSLKNMTFDGMETGDKFTFHAGQYSDVTLKNVHGGEIIFADHSQVSNLSINGKEAAISVGENVLIDNVTVSDRFSILTLNVGDGSTIRNSDLRNASIDMASNLQGSNWQSVQLGANLKHVDFTGATLNNVSISGDSADGKLLSGVDFTGAKISNLKINGELITSTNRLKELGADVAQTQLIATEDALATARSEKATAAALAVAQEAAKWMNGTPATTEQSSFAVAKPQQDKGREGITREYLEYYKPDRGNSIG